MLVAIRVVKGFDGSEVGSLSEDAVFTDYYVEEEAVKAIKSIAYKEIESAIRAQFRDEKSYSSSPRHVADYIAYMRRMLEAGRAT